ncbi:MAG: beta-galactosidase [Hyphomicrobiales bacterium]|nr:beta-galactosidase [Hyphomicrobiales bacterium]
MLSDDQDRALGVCYYPEHWPEETWSQDARRMRELGIRFVRIGEFAWSKLEPARADYQFDWLNRAIDILHAQGLSVVLGTPTATPPKWLVDEMPDMLGVDADGQIRKFGSRRHYSFSHTGYRSQCQRIVSELAKRFGTHPAVVAWQTDNEYGCHNTTLSFSPVDLAAFRNWLARKYQSVDALNKAWGNTFWSMEYGDIDEVELPNLTVTEANPAHRMDYQRFASDMVIEFNRLQVEILRKYSPGRDIVHNFMGRILDFDHFALGNDLDISSWDSYPLGFLEDRSDNSDEWKSRFARTGDPDFQAFHHDLYRATSKGRWWVMEQQPGPVNWAPHNPAPRSGMVRLWSLEALAHGAQTVSYFRWRQAPFAQEQMHSGLLRSDGVEAEGFHEVEKVQKDIRIIKWPAQALSQVAIVFDYTSSWAWEIQPQGKEFDYFRLIFDHYRILRKLGFSIDFISSQTRDLSGYKLVIVPGLFAWTPQLRQALVQFDGEILIGPRSGSKTVNFSIPDQLPPDLPTEILDLKVSRVESLRSDCPVKTRHGKFRFWREHVIAGPETKVEFATSDGSPALVRQNNITYLCGWPDGHLLQSALNGLAEAAGLKTRRLPDGVRLRRSGDLTFVFNYGDCDFDASGLELGECRLGGTQIPPSGVSVFESG